jgi:hypothetical protein
VLLRVLCAFSGRSYRSRRPASCSRRYGKRSPRVRSHQSVIGESSTPWKIARVPFTQSSAVLRSWSCPERP